MWRLLTVGELEVVIRRRRRRRRNFTSKNNGLPRQRVAGNLISNITMTTIWLWNNKILSFLILSTLRYLHLFLIIDFQMLRLVLVYLNKIIFRQIMPVRDTIPISYSWLSMISVILLWECEAWVGQVYNWLRILMMRYLVSMMRFFSPYTDSYIFIV
jgi:hypothetical protein